MGRLIKSLMKSKIVILLISFMGFAILSCKSHKQQKQTVNWATTKEKMKMLEDSLTFTQVDKIKLKQREVLINEIYKTLKDNVSKDLVQRRLDSFLLEKETEHEIITSLELDRAFKGTGITIENSRDIDPSKVPHFDNPKDVKKYIETFKEEFKKSFESGIEIDSSATANRDKLLLKKKNGYTETQRPKH